MYDWDTVWMTCDNARTLSQYVRAWYRLRSGEWDRPEEVMADEVCRILADIETQVPNYDIRSIDVRRVNDEPDAELSADRVKLLAEYVDAWARLRRGECLKPERDIIHTVCELVASLADRVPVGD